MSELHLSFALPPGLEQALRAAYASPPRAYHCFEHVGEVLAHVAQVPCWDDLRSVELAVLFHDAVYEAGRPDNELRSAQLMAAQVPQYLDGVDVKRVEELILLTAKHGKLEPDHVDRDAALFLDCDMAILAAEPGRYAEYERAIAREYAAVPADLYRAGRGAFLRGLLAKPRIYLSAYFHERYDARARDNLQRALSELANRV